MNEVRITAAYRKTILSDSELILVRNGIPTFSFCIRTIRKRHAESGQPVYARAAPVRCVLGSEMLKEGTAGFLAARSRSGQAMELCCIGSGSISTLKIRNERSSTWGRESALRIWVAGPSTPLGS